MEIGDMKENVSGCFFLNTVYKLHNKSYEGRLRTLDLPTLKYRRLRGDMIETYKILSRHYDVSVSQVIPLVTDTVTRSNTLKIRNRRTHYDTRKYTVSQKNWATFLRPITLEILNRSLPNWA